MEIIDIKNKKEISRIDKYLKQSEIYTIMKTIPSKINTISVFTFLKNYFVGNKNILHPSII